MTLVLAAALLMVGTLSQVGAQENSGNGCQDGELNSHCNSDLARLCTAFLSRWQAAGGEISGITVPDWCDTDNLPTSGDNENACEGGLLDDRCESNWEWTCGYYLQQWEAAGGWNGSYTVPDWCDPASLLPPRPEGPTEPRGACYTNRFSSFYYTGTSNSEISEYTTTDCSGAALAYTTKYGIEAADLDSAQIICESLGTIDPAVWKPSNYGYDSPNNLWLCTED